MPTMMQTRAPHLRWLQQLTALCVLCGPITVRADVAEVQSAPSSPVQASDEEAATRFQRGLALFNESEYALALIEFERAYELAPNFRALYNIGLVNIQLGRYASATRALERYLLDGEAAIGGARRREVEGLLGDLKLRTATLTLLSRASGIEVAVDGKTLGTTPFPDPLLIDAGEHTLRATAAGFAPRNYTLTLAGQDQKTIQVALDPLPRHGPVFASKPERRLFWPGFVAAGALGAGAVAASIIMFDARSDLDTLKGNPGSEDGARQNAADRANVAAISADVFAGLAVVTGGVSLYLSLRKERPRRTDVSFSPRSAHATFRF